MGVIAMQTSERNGRLVGAVQVFEGDELMLISNQGTLVRTRADEVSMLGPQHPGCAGDPHQAGETLVGVERIDEPDDEDDRVLRHGRRAGRNAARERRPPRQGGFTGPETRVTRDPDKNQRRLRPAHYQR